MPAPSQRPRGPSRARGSARRSRRPGDRHHRPERARQHQVARPQRRPTPAMVSASHSMAVSGLPRQAAPAPTETGSPRCSIDHAAQPQVEVGEAPRRAAEHEQRRRGVVGDGVDEWMFQLAMRLSTISIAGSAKSIARTTSATVTPAVIEVAAEHDRDLGLDLGLHQAAPRHLLAVADAPCRRTACRSRAGRRRAASAPPATSGRSCGRPAAGPVATFVVISCTAIGELHVALRASARAAVRRPAGWPRHSRRMLRAIRHQCFVPRFRSELHADVGELGVELERVQRRPRGRCPTAWSRRTRCAGRAGTSELTQHRPTSSCDATRWARDRSRV